MGSSRKSGRSARSVVLRLWAVLVAACLAFCLTTNLTARTQRGVQCPTAMVQSVVVAKRDCCDRKVRYEVRKPREGEKGFVQCRCEEKRQGATKAVAAPRNDALPPTSTTVELPSLPLLAWSVPAYLSCAIEWAISPAFRPPTYA